MMMLLVLVGAALIVLSLYLALSKGTEATQFRSSAHETFSALWKAWCWVYIIPWRMWYKLQHAVARALIATVTFVSFFIVLDAGLVFVHHRQIAQHIPWLSESSFAQHFDLPLWIDLPALGVAILLSWHHVREWKTEKRKDQLPRVVEQLLQSFGKASPPITTRSHTEKDVLFQSLIGEFRKALEERRKQKISASLMEEATAGTLTVKFMHNAEDGHKFNRDLSLKCGEGIAGAAFNGPKSLYLPSVKRLVAIDAEKVIPDAEMFKPKDPPEPFHSLLCIPVLGKSSPVGVLTFASRKCGAFGPADYETMRLAAVFASFFFD
jgi:hypothetical protein